MRKVVLTHWITFDGYTDLDPGTKAREYMATVDDPEQDRHFVDRLNSVGEHAMGRVTYEQMAKLWPYRNDPVANAMNRFPKLVFTRKGDVPTPWGPARVITGDAARAVVALKGEEGGDILVHGGNSLVRSLLEAGLIDELRLNVLPIAIGRGLPLFADLGRLQKLRVLGATVFPSGVQEVVLAPDRS